MPACGEMAQGEASGTTEKELPRAAEAALWGLLLQPSLTYRWDTSGHNKALLLQSEQLHVSSYKF